MIIGIGSDLTSIPRIERAISRFGDRFLERVFTATERERAQRRGHPATAFATRFAAKEACSKALGTGLRAGVFWRDMAVDNRSGGRPTMQLTGGALRRLQNLLPPGMKARIDVSLSDEPPMAQAFVVISAIPEAENHET